MPGRKTQSRPTISGELTSQDAFDKIRKDCFHEVHELHLKAGEIYLIELKSLDFEPFLRLEDAASKTLREHDPSREPIPDATIGFAPKESAKYRAVATTVTGGIPGEYSLRVGLLKKLGEPRTIEGQLTETSKTKEDQYFQEHSLEHQVGDLWLIDLRSKDFDPLLRAVTSKQEPIATDDNGGEGLNSRLILGFAESGEHRLQATGLVAGAKGNYTLQLQRLERSACGSTHAGRTVAD